jgi:hypothetical protein
MGMHAAARLLAKPAPRPCLVPRAPTYSMVTTSLFIVLNTWAHANTTLASQRKLQVGCGNVFTRVSEVNTACCPSGGGHHRRRTQTCTPTTCSSSCATIFVPFLDDCGTILQAAGQDLSSLQGLYYSCRQAASSAGCAAASLLPSSPPTPTYTYFSWQGISQADARNRCLAGGGDLASIHSAQQNAAIVAAAGGASGEMWIGLSDTQIEGVWLWSDGSPFDYNHWNTGEPNNAGNGEDHVGIHTDPGNSADATWNDADGTSSSAYLRTVTGYACANTP